MNVRCKSAIPSVRFADGSLYARELMTKKMVKFVKMI